MRRHLLTIFVLLATCWAQGPAQNIPVVPIPSTRDRKTAEKEFKQGLKEKEHGKLNEALDHFRRAADLNPRSVDFITAREVTRQLLIYQDVERGNLAMLANQRIEAMAAFRSALELDPTNEFARQRLQDSLPSLPRVIAVKPDKLAGSLEINLRPSDAAKSFKFRGNSRDLLEQIARAYKLIPVIEDSVVNRNVRFDIDNVHWNTAAEVVSQMTKVFWTPLSANQVLFVADNQQNRRQYERMALRTFYLENTTAPQDLNDVANTLRILFDIRYMTQQPASNSIIVRAPQPVLDAVEQFLDALSTSRPQVLLDIKAYEVSGNLTRNIGVAMPTNFQAYNVPTEAQKLLGNQSIQDIIDQLISSGAINQANSTAIAALIAQGLGAASSIFSIPFFTFGGGMTLTAVTIPPATVKFSSDKSDVRSLEHVTLRAAQGTAANFKIGTRYPIVNATFAPIYNSPQISKVLQNQSYISPVPSFQFEDLGLVMKATPQIREHDVVLNLEMQVRALGPTSYNGVPIISNREYKGVISSGDDQQIVIAGMVSTSEQHGLLGVPVLSSIPVAGLAVTSDSKANTETELLIVITPHIVRSAERNGVDILMPVTAPR